MTYVIAGVGLGPETVEIQYMQLPDDVREDVLAHHHTLVVNRAKGDYEDEILDIERACMALLADALEDFHGNPPELTLP